MVFSNEHCLKKVDFLANADNVYRTPEFIVKQSISTCLDGRCCGVIISDDTYYSRTPKRDKIYDDIFEFRGEDINGKRMTAGMYRRRYVE